VSKISGLEVFVSEKLLKLSGFETRKGKAAIKHHLTEVYREKAVLILIFHPPLPFIYT